jgi:hypothetical protein
VVLEKNSEVILEGTMINRYWKKVVIWLIGLDVVVFIGGSLIMAAYTVAQG